MIVRNEEKAMGVIQELSKNSSSKFRVVVVDFSNSLE